MYPKPLVRYMVAVEVVTGLALAVSLFRIGPSLTLGNILIFLGFAIVCLLASLFPVPMIRKHGYVSVQLPIIFAASIILGPWLAIWLGSVFSITYPEIRGRVKRRSMWFNRAHAGLTAFFASGVFALLGGNPAHLNPGTISLPLFVGGLVAFFSNMFFVMFAVKFRINRSIREVYKVYFKWASLNFFGMFPIAYLMAVVFHSAGVLPEIFIMMPLAMTRWIFDVAHRIRAAYQSTVRTLLTAMDAKDPYTKGHSFRVGRYAVTLAHFMKVPEDEAEEIERAGTLHDIGKLAVVDEVLNKPGELDYEEMLSMQRHTVMGSTMLGNIGGVGPARDWVLHHHERYDGQGYPHGISGEEIPLGARIISVVDSYDAMTSDRPYRKAMSHEKAVDEILKNAGGQFDPKVVRAFMDMLRIMGDFADEVSIGEDFEEALGRDTHRRHYDGPR